MTVTLKHRGRAPAALCFIVAAAVSASAMQPYEIIQKDPKAYYAKQAGPQCGPAAFYMLVKYYKDHLKRFYDTSGNPVDLSLGSNHDKNNTRALPDRVTGESGVSQWIKGGARSTGWKRLLNGTRELYSKNKEGNLQRYYTCVDSHDSMTGRNKKGGETRMTNFKKRIKPLFLNENRPVIVHLKRRWPFPGHYIVLVGYDESKGVVYYMDPNLEEYDDLIQEVPFKTFIDDDYWYEGNAPAFWGNARWSGRWLGFYHK